MRNTSPSRTIAAPIPHWPPCSSSNWKQHSARVWPVRRQIVQYNEGTGAFVRRLLRRRGISWYFRPGRAADSHAPEAAGTASPTPAHTMVLFQDAKRLPLCSAGTIRFHRDSATEERDTLAVGNPAAGAMGGASLPNRPLVRAWVRRYAPHFAARRSRASPRRNSACAIRSLVSSHHAHIETGSSQTVQSIT